MYIRKEFYIFQYISEKYFCFFLCNINICVIFVSK
nr:MAG TPA: hypothetical protein [Caudoviricetes sp.]DAO84969.1 MAG TPA: hypothetical protein [Caudoviricetes sp.]